MRANAAQRAAACACTVVLLAGLTFAAVARPRPASANEEVTRRFWLWPKDAASANLRVFFELRDGEGTTRVDQSTNAVPYALLRGLTAADVVAATPEMRKFEIVEDPGTLTFKGVFGNGGGKGVYDFTSDPAFQRQLERRGMRPATDLEALQLALHHFKVAALDDVTASGLQGLTPADLVTMVDHGMTTEFVRGFRGVTLVPKTMAALATLRDHGITADYVQAFGSTGYPPVSVDELSSLRDHGVKPSLVRAIAHSSYRSARPAEIAAFADHGVPGEYITELDRIGYHPVPADVARLRDRGVPVSFIQRLREHGYGSMSVSDIIKLFEHGI